MPLGLGHASNTSTLFAVGGDRANATPLVAMLNVLFLREHNRLAEKLEAANQKWNDERVFQTARNILIVLFIKIVVEEYINHINTTNLKFQSDPSIAWRARWNKPNWMTAEFSLLYRWHSLIPESFIVDGMRIDSSALLLDNTILLTSGLSNAFVAASSNWASELGLGNTASFVWGFEEKALAQARLNSLATYNDYRRAMKLDPARDFADIVGKSRNQVEKTRRTALAGELERLYGTVEKMLSFMLVYLRSLEKRMDRFLSSLWRW